MLINCFWRWNGRNFDSEEEKFFIVFLDVERNFCDLVNYCILGFNILWNFIVEFFLIKDKRDELEKLSNKYCVLIMDENLLKDYEKRKIFDYVCKWWRKVVIWVIVICILVLFVIIIVFF